MDKIKLVVDRKLGLKNEHYEVEYPASDIGALRNYVSWVMKLNLFDSIIIYRKDSFYQLFNSFYFNNPSTVNDYKIIQ